MKTIALPLALAAGLFAQSAAAQDPAEVRAEALVKQAQTLLQQGDEAGGLKLLGEAVTLVDNPDGMHQLGHMYQGATKVSDKDAQALRWFKLAAERKQPDSLAHYGEALIAGQGVAPDHDKGVEMLLESRKLGYHKAYDILGKIAAEQKQAIECATAMAQQKGYKPDDAQSVVMRASEWTVVRSGSGEKRRGDRLDIYGASADGMLESSAYNDLSVSASGFTGIKTNEIPLSEGKVFRYEETTGYTDAGPQGRRDAEEILRACKR